MYAIVVAMAAWALPSAAQECPLPVWSGAIMPVEAAAEGSIDQIQLEAGRADLDAYGISRLEDGVTLRRGAQHLRAQALVYDHAQRRAHAEGAVSYEETGTQVSAEAAALDLGADRVDFTTPRFVLSDGGRGAARSLQLSPRDMDLRAVEYTTCAGDRPAWAIRGARIRIDADAGQGTAHNMQLRFFDVPVLYLPWFRFPASPARQTGLLFPALGSTNQAGFFIRWPLYINLHPQADLQLTPEWLSRRGPILGGQLRGLWRAGSGEIGGRWLDRDDITGESRGEMSARVDTRVFERTRAELRYAEVSDIDFLRELGQNAGDSAVSVLERSLELSWRPLPAVQSRVRVVDFQILDPRIDTVVFAREPELALDWRPQQRWFGLRPHAGVEAVRFTANDSTSDRVDAVVGLDWALQRRGWETELRGMWRATRYRDDGTLREARDLPTLRAGIAANFIRPVVGGLLQTLRPRLDYVYTPFREQSQLPLFDTNVPDFSLDQMLSGNRFSGIDRISDENTLIPSLESSLLDPASGIRRARLRLGLQLRLNDSRVMLAEQGAGSAGSSDWLVELDVDAAAGVRGRAAGQYNTDQSRFDALSLGGRYLGARGQRLQLGYRFRRDLFEQVDALVLWPVSAQWTMAARWNRALDADRSLETLLGVAYQSCCWGLTTGVRRYINGSAGDFDTGVFVQFSFRGLGDFGSGFGDLFRRDSLSY